MAAFPETQLERSYGYTWLDTIVWNQRQEVERACLKLTLILQADKTDISCSLIATPPVSSPPQVTGTLPWAYVQTNCVDSSVHEENVITHTHAHTHTHTHTLNTANMHTPASPRPNFKSEACECGSRYRRVCPGWLMGCNKCSFTNDRGEAKPDTRQTLPQDPEVSS